MRIARETLIIAAIGIADLITTLVWVAHQGAQEANPIFAKYLAMGPVWFALMKLVLLAAPLFLIEWARRRRPVFTRWASRLAIVAYIGMYGIGVWHANSDDFREYMSLRTQMAQADAGRQRMLADPSFRRWMEKHHWSAPDTLASMSESN